MAVKNEKQWKLKMPFVAFSFEKKNNEKEVGQASAETGGIENKEQEDVELTPIDEGKNSKKKKKSKKNKK